MMKKPIEWILLFVLAITAALSWCRFAFPRYQEISLAVDQSKAIALAKDFLNHNRGFNTEGYSISPVFRVDENVDRYLQKTIGTAAASQLLKSLNYDLFLWVVRFYKEKQKEEFKVVVGSSTGQILGLFHDVEDTSAQPDEGKEAALHRAIDFLKSRFAFDPVCPKPHINALTQTAATVGNLNRLSKLMANKRNITSSEHAAINAPLRAANAGMTAVDVWVSHVNSSHTPQYL